MCPGVSRVTCGVEDSLLVQLLIPIPRARPGLGPYLQVKMNQQGTLAAERSELAPGFITTEVGYFVAEVTHTPQPLLGYPSVTRFRESRAPPPSLAPSAPKTLT